MSEQESRHTNREGSFDDLAKGLATGTISRGRALRMLGAALVGGAFASIPGAAWAACKQPFSKCTANTQCCSRRCIKNPQGNGRICGCPTGKTLCPAGNQCVTCTNTGEVVNLTTCKCECPADTELCNNACVSKVCGANESFNTTTCQCEAVGCTAGSSVTPCGMCTHGRNPFIGCGCYERADGTGTFCLNFGCSSCIRSCDRCPSGSVCVKTFDAGDCEDSEGNSLGDFICGRACYQEDGITCDC
jgi:hypothetical protein